jgi:hypothetical protein
MNLSYPEREFRETEVQGWLQKNGGDAKYDLGRNWDGRIHNEQWLKEVNAALLLRDLFQDLSGAKEQYRKVEYGYSLTDWICEHHPKQFDELASYIEDLLTAGAE